MCFHTGTFRIRDMRIFTYVLCLQQTHTHTHTKADTKTEDSTKNKRHSKEADVFCVGSSSGPEEEEVGNPHLTIHLHFSPSALPPAFQAFMKRLFDKSYTVVRHSSLANAQIISTGLTNVILLMILSTSEKKTFFSFKLSVHFVHKYGTDLSFQQQCISGDTFSCNSNFSVFAISSCSSQQNSITR